MNPQEILILILASALVVAFVFVLIITCLSLIGKARFINPNQQSKLFTVLIVQLVGICLFAFKKSFVDSIPTNPVEKAEEFIKVNKNLSSISPDTLAQSLNPTVGGYIWGEFFRYRILIRSHMRRLCVNKLNIKVDDDESYKTMADRLYKTSIIDSVLHNNISKIGFATYSSQWGAGIQPTSKEAKFVADSAKIVINELSKIN
ncbi:hypothetical protein [Spirosoma aerophilum]